MINYINHLSESGFTWIDLVDPNQDSLKELANQFQLHQYPIQDILQPEHLPKFEQLDNMLFVIARYYDNESKPNSNNLTEVSRKMALFYRDDLIITIHRKPFEGITQLTQQQQLSSSFEVLCKVLKTCFNSYEMPNQKLDEEIDFYENRIFLKKRIPDLLKNLYLIKRQLYLFRKISNLTEEIIYKLEAKAQTGINKPIFQDLKDYYTKVDTQIESNYDDIQNLLTIYLAISSQKTNEVMRTLTVFTAFFLPITFIAGVYGMNFKVMPELTKEWGYPLVLILMVSITIIIYSWFKRKGWI